ncbi:PerC family transcriptional regulator [Serratia marcescens]|uniref:PerC family transcriptional regulator n=1 Tax=Serratia marcescens TaxID=615 RepID=UPI001F08AED4|nr:PerC family transcriptional regulator [Serratia marcescens]
MSRLIWFVLEFKLLLKTGFIDNFRLAKRAGKTLDKEDSMRAHYYCRGNTSSYVALPDDKKALRLESQGLWRRAATRWQQVLLRERDDSVIEAVLHRLRYCLAQAPAQIRRVSDGTAPAGATLIARNGMSNDPALWRTE